MNGIVAAFGRTDCVGAAGIVGAGLERVFSPLTVGLCDWVYGGEIDDVEAHVANGGQPAHDIVKRAVTMRVAALRTGKEFVPAGEFRRSAFCVDRNWRVRTDSACGRIRGRVDLRRFLCEQGGDPAGIVGALKAFAYFLELRRVLCAGGAESIGENGLPLL